VRACFKKERDVMNIIIDIIIWIVAIGVFLTIAEIIFDDLTNFRH